MVNPKEVTTVILRASYLVPVYGITDQGLEHMEDYRIDFCKGNKEDPQVERRIGFLTETLLATCKQYLEENNRGDLFSRETSMAIIKLDEALMWLNKRAEDRKTRGVQSTYKK